MKTNVSKKPIGTLLKFTTPKSPNIRVSFIIFISLFLFSAVPYFLGPGLNTPQPIGAYLDGAFPPVSNANQAPYEVAYQNLTFFYPITFKEIPTRNKIVVGQLDGLVYAFDNNENVATKDVLIDLTNDVGLVSDGGFLGLAVHPEFDQPTNPKNFFYVYYATKNWNGDNSPGFGQYTEQDCFINEYEGNFLILERFEVNPSTMTFVPNTRTTILKNRMYGTAHRGGGMDFGDDGFLYLTLGDQASWQNAQDFTNNLDGGVLRLDVDKDPSKSHAPIRKKPADAGEADEITGEEYWIPNDNPFLSPNGDNFEEYWAVGLRNPHRMTKDSQTGIFYIGDVGLDTQEEVNILSKGKNYGWPLHEGDIPGPGCVTQLLNNMPHEEPLLAFPPDDANSITGGYVYRGSEMPQLFGKYICADFGIGDEIWAVDTDTGEYELLGNFLPEDVISFGEDSQGELFLLKGGFNTPIYKMKTVTVDYSSFPQLLSQTGAFTNLSTLEVADGIIPYELHESFWSDGALKKRWIAVPNNGTHNTPGEQIDYSENGDWKLPVGTVVIKHFDLPIDDNDPNVTRKIETRFSIVDENGQMYFLTYNWNQAQTDATLQTVELDETVNITTDTGGTRTQTWHFPSNTECLTCHNNANNGVLGLKSRYLNNDYTYDETGLTANQLVTLSHLGILNDTITDADTPNILTSKSIYDASASLDEKARSYMDLNCAYCHRSGTDNRANFDLRLFNNLEATELLTAGILSPLGIPDEEIVYPGDASKSILFHRMASLNPGIMMPPIAKSIVDQDAVDLIEQWINQLEAPTSTYNTRDDSINLALLPTAQLSGSLNGGSRGSLEEILYDPRIDDYYVTTPYNEYGIFFNTNLGTPTVDDAFEWRVDWPTPKYINYITFGGAFPNQPQPNTMWRISYLYNDNWTIIDEAQGGWIDNGIFLWGNGEQTPILADAVRVQTFSDGINDLVSIHYRGRGGKSMYGADDSATEPKAALFQYLPLPTECAITNIVAGAQTTCDPLSNTYTQEVTIDYVVAPATGTLNVNGQDFPIESSPQTVTLTNLNSDSIVVDVTAYFTAEPSCTRFAEGLFTAPDSCGLSEIPENNPNSDVNLGLLTEAVLFGTAVNLRGTPEVILYDPVIDDYAYVTDYNEYGINFNGNLGTPDADNGFEWRVNWPNSKFINYITFGGVYPNQPQPYTMWRISYFKDSQWIILDEGQAGWIDSGIFEWGGASQQPIIADALRVQIFSDGIHDLEQIHLRARGGISNQVNDSSTTPKACLIQYIPLDNTCGLSTDPDDYLYCNDTWKNGDVPSNTTDIKDVYIGNGIYTINEDEHVRINNLEIAIDASVIIKEGASITIHGDLDNKGQVQLESTPSKYSSLIVEGNSTGKVLYKRHVNDYNGSTGNDLVSSPVKDNSFGYFALKNPNLFENPNNTNQKLFGPFNEITGAYEVYATDANSSTELVSAMGYRVARDSSEDGTYGTTLGFFGDVETESVDINITQSGSSYDGWNLIGNPYPSYLDFDLFFQHNSSALENGTYNAIYGYDGDANDGWTILNSATTGLLIAPGQAFFVKSKTGGGNISFTPAMQVSGNSDDFIQGRSSSHHGYLKLLANSGSSNYTTEFYFNDSASLGLDLGYDAGFFNDNIPDFAIYSHLVENNNGNAIALQTLGGNAINDVTIPLGLHAIEGQQITISIAQTDIPESINIYLEDTQTNAVILLNSGDYIFTPLADISGTERFYLRFTTNALSTIKHSLDTLNIYTNSVDKTVVISGQLLSDTDFQLYDIGGKLLNSDSLNTNVNKQTIDVSMLSVGVYIIELVSKNNQKRIQKLIIN